MNGEAMSGARGWSFGLQLPVQTLSANTSDPWEHGAEVADLVVVAQTADRAGFDFCGVCDHIAIPDDDYSAAMGATWFDPVATLGYLAAHTSRIHLLSVVWIAAYRHPLQTAKSFGTLAELSGDRIIMGVGAGHVAGEFAALGVDFSTRGRRLDEALVAVRSAWATPYSSFDGEYFSYGDVAVSPRPDALPIWVGGSGRAAWKRCGRLGDGYIPMGAPLKVYPEIVATIEEAADAAGRGGHAFAIGYMPGAAYLDGKVPDGLADARFHSADELASQLIAARQAGANTMHLRFRARERAELCDQIERFADDVAPLVDGA